MSNYRFAFIGPAGTGKTTCANYLVTKRGGKTTSFAKQLKWLCEDIFGWDGEKDEKGRRLLQEIGAAARNYDEDFWMEWMVEADLGYTIDSSRYVDDCRFPNEVERLKDLGFKIVRLVPFDFDLNEEWRTHESETALDDYTADYNIVSFKGDIPALYVSLDQLLEKVENAN